MRLLNSCPRLTHLSLTGVAAFQRDDFQPYCRQAPPGMYSAMSISHDAYQYAEFTQHQRDVFCVFSGTMVSKFRDFLNTSPQFEELRVSLNIARLGRFSDPRSRPAAVPALRQSTGFGEGFDDEMADEDNDFEGLDGSDMVVDAQAQNPAIPPNNHATNNLHTLLNTVGPPRNAGFPQAIPVPPPPPGLGQNPFIFQADPRFLPMPHAMLQERGMLGLFTYRNSINTPFIVGAQPPNQASFARLASRGPGLSTQTSVVQNGEASTGASTATIHRLPDDDDQPDMIN